MGGTTAAARNLISGNGISGIEIDGSGSFTFTENNCVEGNYIGTNISGTQGLGNAVGVLIDSTADFNTVGGTTASAWNLISGNTTGVDITGAENNEVRGNLIGINAAGNIGVGNGIGVTIEGVSYSNTIGGSTAMDRDVISGNTNAGVVINGSAATDNLLAGDFIGTDVDGGFDVPNGIGVLIVAGASGNTVGGITNAERSFRNVISGNTSDGVEILGFLSATAQNAASTPGNLIEGNDIGTNSTGTSALGNNVGLLLSNAPNNTIGSADIDARNVISGNMSIGVQIVGLAISNEQLIGNLIGPDASGDNALPASAISNPTLAAQQTGILINGSTGNTIGGLTSSDRNVVSGNGVGIEFTGIVGTSAQPTNTVAGNYIGIGIHQKALGNVIGIWVNDVSDTQIGLPGAANFISGNSQEGIYIIGRDASANLVQGNVIGLGPDGQTYNTGRGKDPTYPFPIGIYIQDSSSNVIGGSVSEFGNTISGNNVGVYIVGNNGSSTNNQVMANFIGLPFNGGHGHGNKFYGVMLYNAPANNVAQSGPSRNRFAHNQIANFREFSGSAAKAQSSSVKGSNSKAKKPAHRSKHVATQSRRGKAHHESVTIHGRHVPAGPIRKRHA